MGTTNAFDIGTSTNRLRTLYYTNLDPAPADSTTIVSANGFSGSGSPNITLSCTANGLLKSNGTSVSAAVATDINGVALTGYTSGAGTVAATDSIVQSIGKLNGNDSLALPKTGGAMTGPITMGNNSISGISILSGNINSRNADSIVSFGGFPVNGNLAYFSTGSGLVISDSAIPLGNAVTTSVGSVVNGHIPQYSGTGGRIITTAGCGVSNLDFAGAMTYGISSATSIAMGSGVIPFVLNGTVSRGVSKASFYSTAAYTPAYPGGVIILTPPSAGVVAGTLVNFTMSTPGKLTYNGIRTRTFKVDTNWTVLLGANGANNVFIQSKNGSTAISTTQSRTGGSVGLFNTGASMSYSVNDTVVLAPGDTIETAGSVATGSQQIQSVSMALFEVGD
jgi:hypothetical protein